MIRLIILLVLTYGGIKDWRKRIIPDAVPAAILVLGITAFFLPADHNIGDSLLGFALPTVTLLILYYLGKPVGGGDLKLLAALGLALGLSGLVPVLMIAAVTGGIWALVKREKSIPLGAFLDLGYAVTLMMGG